MYTGCGLLTYTLYVPGHILPVGVALYLGNLLECVQEFTLIGRPCLIIQSPRVFLTLYAQMYHQCGVTAVIDYHVGTSLGEVHGLQCAPPVLLCGLTLPGKHSGTAGSGNCSSGMILC